MRNWLFLLTIIVFSILQVTFLDNFRIFNVKPDLLLIGVVVVSLYFELKWALIVSILAGILKDTLGISALGINTLLFPAWTIMIIKLSKKISIDTGFIAGLLVFATAMLNTITVRLLLLFLGDLSITFFTFMRILFIESLYTAFLYPLVFKIIRPLTLKSKEPVFS